MDGAPSSTSLVTESRPDPQDDSKVFLKANGVLRSSTSSTEKPDIGEDCEEHADSKRLNTIASASPSGGNKCTTHSDRLSNCRISWKSRALHLEELLMQACKEIVRCLQQLETPRCGNLPHASSGEHDKHIDGISEGAHLQTVQNEKDKCGIDPFPSSSEASGQALIRTIRKFLSSRRTGETELLTAIRSNKNRYSLSPVDSEYLAKGNEPSHYFRPVENPPPLKLSEHNRGGPTSTEERTDALSAPRHPIIVLDITSIFSCSSPGSQRNFARLTTSSIQAVSPSGERGDEKAVSSSLLEPLKRGENKEETRGIFSGKSSAKEDIDSSRRRPCGQDESSVKEGSHVAIQESELHSFPDQKNCEVMNCTSMTSPQTLPVIIDNECGATTVSGIAAEKKATLLFEAKPEGTMNKWNSPAERSVDKGVQHSARSDQRSSTGTESETMEIGHCLNERKNSKSEPSSTQPVGTERDTKEDREEIPSVHLTTFSSAEPPALTPQSAGYSSTSKTIARSPVDLMISERLLEKYEHDIEQLRRENSLLRYRERRAILEGKRVHRVSGSAGGNQCGACEDDAISEVGGVADAWKLSTFCGSTSAFSPPSKRQDEKNAWSTMGLMDINAGESPAQVHSVPSESSLLGAQPWKEELEIAKKEWNDEIPSSACASNFDKEDELRRLRILMRFSYLKKDSDELEVMKKEMKCVLQEHQRLQNVDKQNKAKIQEMQHCVKAIHEILCYILSVRQKEQLDRSRPSSDGYEARNANEAFLLQHLIASCKPFICNSGSTNSTTTLDPISRGETTSNLERQNNSISHMKSHEGGVCSPCGELQLCYSSFRAPSSPDGGSQKFATSAVSRTLGGKPPMLFASSTAHNGTRAASSAGSVGLAQRLPTGKTASSFSFPSSEAPPFGNENGKRSCRKEASRRPSTKSSYRRAVRLPGDAGQHHQGLDDNAAGQGGISRVQQAIEDARGLASVLQQHQSQMTDPEAIATTVRGASKR